MKPPDGASFGFKQIEHTFDELGTKTGSSAIVRRTLTRLFVGSAGANFFNIPGVSNQMQPDEQSFIFSGRFMSEI
ncbi:MAG: hypothetical protein K2X93_01980 [Candidatus Obscuribacterales bacterium]|nr:hypothetical protein [Candidatus Obscuribacterales bacterium]